MASSMASYGNMLHSERLGTFIEANWPNTDSFLHLCNPQKLAQAGLEFHSVGEARCVVCLHIVKNLEPTSDPWICHANINPDCPLILLGKPNKPDDYTVKEWLQFVSVREMNIIELQFLQVKREVAERFVATLLAGLDNASNAQHCNSNIPPASARQIRTNLNKSIPMISDSDSDVDMV